MNIYYNNYYNKSLKHLARNLRKQSTKAEIKLWGEALKAKQLKGYQFLRQRPVANYIADFMCKDLKLIIEADGATHNEDNYQADQTRKAELEKLGFTVLRFHDEEIMNDIDNVRRSLENWVEDKFNSPQ